MTGVLFGSLVFVISLCCVGETLAQQQPWLGRVVDDKTGDPLAGVSVRVEGTTRGTYTHRNGNFRLPAEGNTVTLRVSAVGFAEKVVTLANRGEQVTIGLERRDVTSKPVTVVADMEVEEVIRRAIAQRSANAARVETLVMKLYSKLFVSADARVAIRADTQQAIGETYSTVYDRRSPIRQKKSIITQRRQTQNMGAANNLAVLDEFSDFMSDEVEIINTKLVNPLGNKALENYSYKLVDRKILGDKYVYEIDFWPQSRLYPGFQGRVVIYEDTWQVVEYDISPSPETAFLFIRDLRMAQRFRKYNDSIWIPAWQEVSASASAAFIKGLAEMDARVVVQATVTEAQVNEVIPDSVFSSTKSGRSSVSISLSSSGMSSASMNASVEVDPGADTTTQQFWESHSFADQTAEEIAVYRRADSIAASDTTAKKSTGQDESPVAVRSSGGVTFGLEPILDRTSLTSLLYGGTAEVSWVGLTISGGGAVGSANTKMGLIELSWKLPLKSSLSASAGVTIASAFGRLQRHWAGSIELGHINITNLLWAGYFDFFRRDGISVHTQARYRDFFLHFNSSWERAINMTPHRDYQRELLQASPGNFSVQELQLSFANQGGLLDLLKPPAPIRGYITLLHGKEKQQESFTGIAGAVNTNIPTFRTGYTPMMLSIAIHGGIVSSITPSQYHFYFVKRFPVAGFANDLATIPANTLGGTEYLSNFIAFNFSDVWWRWLTLPTYQKRGAELKALYNVARINQMSASNPTVIKPTGGWYQEAGISISRIPTYVSDFIYLEADFLCPVGSVADRVGGRFAWALSVRGVF